mgnify:CR=1 FL=1
MGAETSEMDTTEETVTTDRDGQDTAHDTPTTEMDDEGEGTNKGTKKQHSELDSLRQQLKDANNESASRRHKIAELEKQIKDKERAEMDEAERLKAELADLQEIQKQHEQISPQFERYEAAVKAQVEALKTDLKIPDYIGKLLDGMSPADQLEYLIEHREQLQPEEQKRKPEFNSDKKSSSKTTTKDKEARQEKLKKRMRLHRR